MIARIEMHKMGRRCQAVYCIRIYISK